MSEVEFTPAVLLAGAATAEPTGTTAGRHQADLRGTTGVQVGDYNTQHNYYAGRPVVSWPHLVGVAPPVAVGRLDRPADTTLHAALTTDGTAAGAVVVCQVLAGLGGVGKTQLATNLAQRWWQHGLVDLLVWVTATSRIEVLTRYAQTAADVTGVEDSNPGDGAQRLLAWLASSGRRWLIVLDDLTDPADLQGLWPPVTITGRTVVTTRRRDAALIDGRTMIDVDVFTPAEAVEYLHGKLGNQPHRVDEAADLAQDLGWLPLALAQAAAYITDQDLTCAGYRRRLSRRDLHALRPSTLPDDQHAAVANTWALSIDLADTATGGIAGILLQLASLLDPNGIPPQLFTTTAVTAYCAARIGQPVEANDAHDAVRALHRLGLVTAPTGSDIGAVRVHALLQRVVRENTPHQYQSDLAITAADAISELWPSDKPDVGAAQPLRVNTIALNRHASAHLWTARQGAHPVLFQTGRSLGNIGLVAAARDYFSRLHDTGVRHLGSRHADTLRARSNYAWWQGKTGEVARAIAAGEQLLVDQVQVLGPGHPDTLSTRNDLLAWQAQAQADAPARAARTFQELVDDYVRYLGVDHPGTLTARNNLARWRGRAGDLNGAIKAFQALVHDSLRILGPDHLGTLRARSNLAWWQGEAGDPAGAVDTYRQVLNDRLRAFGPDHPDTLRTRSNIASWQGHAGDPAGAVDIHGQVLVDRLRVLGPDHPDTFRTRSYLASWLGRAGDAVSAATAFEQLLTDQLRVLGPDHPLIVATRDSLAHWKRVADAQPASEEGAQ
ncbi:FxSxx-COOH system tetratricopeptide repeat protein [Dactylosporangium sp. NPDC005555]|uniref:FxSxx-COOH system tetratricopeptide repeat protein n=1 Tax=Dactylosporangium sp. NPDC005555 TaxID=3154889 RepID=UPI0033A9ECD3